MYYIKDCLGTLENNGIMTREDKVQIGCPSTVKHNLASTSKARNISHHPPKWKPKPSTAESSRSTEHGNGSDGDPCGEATDACHRAISEPSNHQPTIYFVRDGIFGYLHSAIGIDKTHQNS